MLDELDRHGVVRTADLPGSARTLSRLAARGVVARMFPGIYALAAHATVLEVRCAALMLWDPDAVITGHAAAKLSFWDEADVDQIEFHSTRKKWAPRGYRLHRSRVPVADVITRRGLRMTRAARTAVHLARHDLGEAIDRALFAVRELKARHLDQALERARGRWGNGKRRPVVWASRDEPWSQFERAMHELLRDAGIKGWVANLGVVLDKERSLDIAFKGLRVVIEADSYVHHSKRNQFEDDRDKQNALVEHGWWVIRVTWRMLADPVRLVALIKRVLALARQDAHRNRRRQSAASKVR
ncbi:type IV toxin-antitoxin system AbiEi family antitoxin domain-containing protein [Propionibacteriaceae bacterium G1746]